MNTDIYSLTQPDQFFLLYDISYYKIYRILRLQIGSDGVKRNVNGPCRVTHNSFYTCANKIKGYVTLINVLTSVTSSFITNQRSPDLQNLQEGNSKLSLHFPNTIYVKEKKQFVYVKLNSFRHNITYKQNLSDTVVQENLALKIHHQCNTTKIKRMKHFYH